MNVHRAIAASLMFLTATAFIVLVVVIISNKQVLALIGESISKGWSK